MAGERGGREGEGGRGGGAGRGGRDIEKYIRCTHSNPKRRNAAYNCSGLAECFRTRSAACTDRLTPSADRKPSQQSPEAP